MVKIVTIIVGLAAMLLAGGFGAQAETKMYWDAGKGRFVKYDTERMRGGRAIEREVIRYNGPYGPDTIVVNTSERRLYHIFAPGKAMKYGIGVGREGFQWAGTNRISRKAEWPGWTPPPQMVEREAAKGRILPAYMEGGPRNPLGARALYIGSTLYRIHGSNEPWTIGRAVSSGCIRMTNEDIIHLYDRVKVGTKVVVIR